MKQIILLFLSMSFICCQSTKKEILSPSRPIWGADISWITEMESSGRRFYNKNGTQEDPFVLMKNLGAKAIRLRVWVNPTDGWNGRNDLIAKARRAHQLGLRLLINFHYSDFWADPGKQNPPAQWTSYNVPQLQAAVRTHTREILMALKDEGIRPDWVQVGNETNDGMLWPLGKASVSMSNYAAFFQAGYEAVKSVDTTIQVMVHLSNGYDRALYEWNLNGLKQAGANWDAVGMSLYPTTADWQTVSDQCLSNMQWIINQYRTPVMIAEVGMPADQPQVCYSFLSYLKNRIDSIPNSMALGIFYWEPQCYANWKGYGLGAFDDAGRPTRALDAFKMP
jgi:arabinogalactan endo-1,4-beta-galactosidase